MSPNFVSGDLVDTPGGRGRVIRVNKESVKVRLEQTCHDTHFDFDRVRLLGAPIGLGMIEPGKPIATTKEQDDRNRG